MSEKRFDPTPKRLRQAKERGQFPQSRILGAAVASLGTLGGLGISAAQGSSELASWTQSLFLGPPTPVDVALVAGLKVLGRFIALPLLGGLVGGMGAVLLTRGISFNLKLAGPKWERVNPFAGAQRLFSFRPALEGLKGMALAALLLWPWATGVRDDVVVSGIRRMHIDGIGPWISLMGSVQGLAMKWACLCAALGALDYLWARRRHFLDLRMTLEERKREHREAEGDPHYKARRLAHHRALAEGGPQRGVAQATALVVNPTHLAVGLRYAPSESEAPYLVAKGRAKDAVALRARAVELGIPVVQDVPLARSLFALDVGEPVPEELYQAAAAVLRVAADELRSDPVGPAPARSRGGGL